MTHGGTFPVDGKEYTPDTWRKKVEDPWVRFFTVVVVVGVLVCVVSVDVQ